MKNISFFKNVKQLISALIFSAVVAVSISARADDTPTGDVTLTELSSVRDGLVDAFRKRDTAAIFEFVKSDIVVTWQNGEVSHGKAELQAFMDKMLNGPKSVVTQVDGSPTVEGRKISGDYVISYGHMNDTFTLRSTGQILPFDSRYSAFLVRENGKLLLSGLHLSINAFDNPILNAAVGMSKKLVIGGSLIALILGLLLGKFVFGRSRA